MTLEVGNLLSQAMLDVPSPRSRNSTPRRPNPVVILTPPPHKPEELLQPVDTSSQASTQEEAKMAEASQEGVPNTISPIPVTTRSESITPPTDAAELLDNANKALKELLAMKASIDACRWRAVWELGMELCWNESKATKSLKEANASASVIPRMLRPCVSLPSIEQRSSTPKPSKRLRSPEAALFRKLRLLALWLSGISRPREPLRPNYCKGDMAKSCKTWRSKSSDRKAIAKVTSCLLAMPPYM